MLKENWGISSSTPAFIDDSVRRGARPGQLRAEVRPGGQKPRGLPLARERCSMARRRASMREGPSRSSSRRPRPRSARQAMPSASRTARKSPRPPPEEPASAAPVAPFAPHEGEARAKPRPFASGPRTYPGPPPPPAGNRPSAGACPAAPACLRGPAGLRDESASSPTPHRTIR